MEVKLVNTENNKVNIVFFNDKGEEVITEIYTENHPCYNWDFNNLSELKEYLIRQRLGI